MPPHKIETGHQDVVHDIAMDYYGKRLATASSDNMIKIIGVSGNSHQQLATLSGHQGPVWQVAWAHPKFGSMLASCSYDGRVIIWKEGSKPEEWAQAHTFSEHKSSVNSIAWAPHELGLCLACGSSDGNISVFSARSDGGWDTTRIDQAHPVGVTSVSWAPAMAPGALISSGTSGQFEYVQKLASGGCDNTVKVWKLNNGSWRMDCFPALQMHKDWVRDVAWAPNLGLPKSTIASASQDGTVVIWTAAKEGEQWEGRVLYDFRTPVWRLSWSLTGNILAVSDGNNNVTLWKEAVDGFVSVTEEMQMARSIDSDYIDLSLMGIDFDGFEENMRKIMELPIKYLDSAHDKAVELIEDVHAMLWAPFPDGEVPNKLQTFKDPSSSNVITETSPTFVETKLVGENAEVSTPASLIIVENGFTGCTNMDAHETESVLNKIPGDHIEANDLCLLPEDSLTTEVYETISHDLSTDVSTSVGESPMSSDDTTKSVPIRLRNVQENMKNDKSEPYYMYLRQNTSFKKMFTRNLSSKLQWSKKQTSVQQPMPARSQDEENLGYQLVSSSDDLDDDWEVL
ncbi:hypothetical protein PR202_gb27133 [Eleusine coracana subsp. coracana]|uniref:Uncharacterized protein n=1 Tax=Eleusine coracana subsp. coracana TaxID=191504 RepID=A0AAV5FTQ1_ELECO|nr:hypothetical protein PR202_gb27133 [Eleusine coracana subsp. coracana]